MIDLDAPAAAIDAADLARARARLGELACASVGLSRRGSASPLADVVDVRVESDAQLRELAAAVHGSPLASLALVQLLRLGASLGIHDGLIAESLVYSVLQSGPEFRACTCAGNSLARMEASLAFTKLLDRFATIERIGRTVRPPRARFRVVTELPVRLAA